MKRNPWNFSKMKDDGTCLDCNWPSPDKKFTLKYSKVKQIINGYPLTGNCMIENGAGDALLHIDAGGPPVWSSDSKFFAVPIWMYNDNGYVQRLGIGSINEMTFNISTDYFKVMKLLSIDGKKVVAIESPNLDAHEIAINIAQLDFYESIHLPVGSTVM